MENELYSIKKSSKRINYKIKNDIITSLSPAAQSVYSVTMTKKRKISYIEKKTKLSPRAVRKAISHLMALELIYRIQDLQDLRSCFYIKADK